METQVKIKKAGKFFAIIMSVLALCLTFTMADFFSSLITVGGFTFTSNSITLPKYNLFAVCITSANTKAQAEENANMCKMQGGAGYLYLYEGKFYIIASVYENESDADKVLTNIKNTNPHSTKINIQIDTISISSNLSSEEKTTLEKALNIFKDTYKELYDISVSLDTGVINEVNARLSVNSLGSGINTISSNFTTLFNAQMTNNFLNIKLKLNELSSTINNLINAPTTHPYTSQLKLAYTETLFIYSSLAQNLVSK